MREERLFGPSFPDGGDFVGNMKLVNVSELMGKPLIFFYLNSPGELAISDLVRTKTLLMLTYVYYILLTLSFDKSLSTR